MNCAQATEEMVSFVKGEMRAADERKFAQHLSECEACRLEELSVREILDVLREFTEIEPSEGFASRVMAQVKRESASSRVARTTAGGSMLWMFAGQRVRQAPFFFAAVAAHAAAIIALACLYLPSRLASTAPPLIDPSTGEIVKGGDEVDHKADGLLPGNEGSIDYPVIPDFGHLKPLPFPSEESVLPGPRNEVRHPRPRWIDPREFAEPLKLSVSRAEVLGWYGARVEGDAKKEALERTGMAKAAVVISRGVAWLAANQAQDGSFEPSSDHPHFRTACTALALLALLGDGSTTGEGPYCGHVSRAVAFLLESQDGDTGRIGPDTGNYMYNHAISVAALAEVYGMSLMRKADSRQKMEPVIDAVRRGVEFLLRAQCPTGGWGYSLEDRNSDTSVSAWPVAALSTALRLRMLPARQNRHVTNSLDAAARWFRHVTDLSGAVGYREPGKYKSGPHSLTAVSLYCRGLFLGTVTPDWKGLYEKQLKMVASRPPSATGKADFYFWYYASSGLHHCDPAVARTFLLNLVEACVSLQQEDGSFRDSSAYGAYGGKVYTTAMAVLALQTPYRFGR